MCIYIVTNFMKLIQGTPLNHAYLVQGLRPFTEDHTHNFGSKFMIEPAAILLVMV